MTAVDSTVQGGDFAIHLESQQYCLLSLPVVNEGVGIVDIDVVAGMPVIIDATKVKASLLEEGLTNFDIAQVNGFLMEGPKEAGLAASGTSQSKYAVIWSGPAVLNRTQLPDADAAGNALDSTNKDAIVAAALANMEDVRFVTEGNVTEQTAVSGGGYA